MNTDQKTTIAALSMDLLRASTGLYRGSTGMAKIFCNEALKKFDTLKDTKSTYLTKLINDTKKYCSLSKKENAEHLLMYSVLFQNYALRKSSLQ